MANMRRNCNINRRMMKCECNVRWCRALENYLQLPGTADIRNEITEIRFGISAIEVQIPFAKGLASSKIEISLLESFHSVRLLDFANTDSIILESFEPMMTVVKAIEDRCRSLPLYKITQLVIADSGKTGQIISPYCKERLHNPWMLQDLARRCRIDEALDEFAVAAAFSLTRTDKCPVCYFLTDFDQDVPDL